MGGKAFQQASAPGERTLSTPRMSTEVYNRLRAQYLQLLQGSLGHDNVETLIPAPEKHDHGDVDFMGMYDRCAGVNFSFAALANEIGAAGVIIQSPLTCSLAVHLDGSRSLRPAVIYRNSPHGPGSLSSGSIDTAEQYAQIDLDMVASDVFNWVRFCNSYGDMLGILGHVVKPLGLSMRHNGVFLRLPELDMLRDMERVNVATEEGCIFLSTDSTQVMEFLHLSGSRYAQGFETLQELYMWLGECRLLSPAAMGIQYDTSRLRRRVATRTVFSEFLQEWLPTYRPELFSPPEGDDDDDDRGQKRYPQMAEQLEIERGGILSEAMSFFEKGEEITAKRRKLQKVIDNSKAASLLMPIIIKHTGKQDQQLTEIMRSFRRFVGVHDDGTPYITNTSWQEDDVRLAGLLTDDQQFFKQPDHVDDWVREHWELVRWHERQRLRSYAPQNEEMVPGPS